MLYSRLTNQGLVLKTPILDTEDEWVQVRCTYRRLTNQGRVLQTPILDTEDELVQVRCTVG